MDMEKKNYQSDAKFLAMFYDFELATMFIRRFNEVYTNRLGIKVERPRSKDIGLLYFVIDLDNL